MLALLSESIIIIFMSYNYTDFSSVGYITSNIIIFRASEPIQSRLTSLRKSVALQ